MDDKYKLESSFYSVCTRDMKAKGEYYLSKFPLEKGDKVIIETSFGVELGVVTSGEKKEEVRDESSVQHIIRKATTEDEKQFQHIVELENKNRNTVKNLINKAELNMTLVEIRYTLDATKVLISYVAEERVDFRELLKMLAVELKCRIELKQIGSRDRSALIGGIGMCGLPICCNSFLKEFDGISINMAKNQMLALNIQKLSGHCGKLLCCLKYEDDFYTEIKKGLDKPGYVIKHKGTQYKITGINYISGKVTLQSEDGLADVITIDDLRGLKKNG